MKRPVETVRHRWNEIYFQRFTVNTCEFPPNFKFERIKWQIGFDVEDQTQQIFFFFWYLVFLRYWTKREQRRA